MGRLRGPRRVEQRRHGGGFRIEEGDAEEVAVGVRDAGAQLMGTCRLALAEQCAQQHHLAALQLPAFSAGPRGQIDQGAAGADILELAGPRLHAAGDQQRVLLQGQAFVFALVTRRRARGRMIRHTSSLQAAVLVVIKDS